MSTVSPRVVLVTRPTELERLVAQHGTLAQARFFLRSQEQPIEPLQQAHGQQQEVTATVRRAIPRSWRHSHVTRADLSRFVFEPADVVVAVGQDGLVANVAKYLERQPVIGVDPGGRGGVLTRFRGDDMPELLPATIAGAVTLEDRTMVEARTDDGQRLRALNEIFVGHRSHQSARYRLKLRAPEAEERQSSSGVIVSTGTGATGWCRSIARERGTALRLPAPTDPRLVFFVREAWPSPWTSIDTTEGLVSGAEAVAITSEMNEGGVVFGDGIEDDRIELPFGRRVQMTTAEHGLRLVAA